MSGANIVNIGGRAVMVQKLVSRPQIGGKMTLPTPEPPRAFMRPTAAVSEESEEEEISLNMIVEEKPSKKIVREYFRGRIATLEEEADEI